MGEVVIKRRRAGERRGAFLVMPRQSHGKLLAPPEAPPCIVIPYLIQNISGHDFTFAELYTSAELTPISEMPVVKGGVW